MRSVNEILWYSLFIQSIELICNELNKILIFLTVMFFKFENSTVRFLKFWIFLNENFYWTLMLNIPKYEGPTPIGYWFLYIWNQCLLVGHLIAITVIYTWYHYIWYICMNTSPNTIFISKIIKYLTYFYVNLQYADHPQYL